MRNCRSEVAPGVFLGLAFLLLALPVPWLLAWLLAALIHEMCHILAVRAFGGQILGIRVGLSGAELEMEPMTCGRELLCALAGPGGGAAMLLFARWFPRLAVCAGIQTLYNLLPVYPLDGGRALRCGARLALPAKTGDILCRMTEVGCLTAIFLLGIYGSLRLRFGFLPLILGGTLIIRAISRKKPCKPQPFHVQ